MWNLTRIKAKNFQTFKDIDIDVMQNRTSLIFGENRDNLIQKSNGSGKSGIIEAITVGTRGTPMRNVRIDEIINDKENSASVTVEYFNDETNELLSIRRKLFRKSSNEVSIYMERDGSPVDPAEYEQSSVGEYNKFIFDTLGITEDEFLNNFVLSILNDESSVRNLLLQFSMFFDKRTLYQDYYLEALLDVRQYFQQFQ